MSIFNSLGSNYSFSFVLRSVCVPLNSHASQKLKTILSEHYQGEVTVTYKGRQALELALKRSGLPQGSRVGINGFTCYVVYQAVQNAGYKPVFIDVSDESLNFGINELRSAQKAYNELKAVIVQNTLGYAADMPAIAEYCRTHHILIIEDLAHSYGVRYGDGTEAGQVGQFTMLSFSQDKPLDVVAGGALIERAKRSETTPLKLNSISIWQRSKNRLYPFWSMLIRTTYQWGFGRLLHRLLKKSHLMATPMSDNLSGIQHMTSRAATLLAGRWDTAEQESVHRRQIAAIYQSELPAEVCIEPLKNSKPLYLRFPILVNDRAGLVRFMKQNKVYIGDTWYDAPIGPKRYVPLTNYQSGQCPRAEKLAEHIVNLPTHIQVNETRARFIAGKVRQWLKSE